MRKKRTSWGEYSYEDTYNKNSLNELEEKRIEEMLKEGVIKSVYATKTIKAGDQFEVEIYPEFTRRQIREQGLPRTNKAQRNLNDRNARKRAERLINANFGKGDLWVTLTYRPGDLPGDIEEAERNMKNYIRRMNYRRGRLGIEKAKYMYVTEYDHTPGGEVRCHHHMIVDGGLSMDEVENLWKKGERNNVRRISPDENGIAGMAQYITKDPKGKKRWKSSKNLKQPEERKNHSTFKASHVKKIVQGKLDIKEITEKKYREYIYTNSQVRYNDKNGRFYIYVRMRKRTRGNRNDDEESEKKGRKKRKS